MVIREYSVYQQTVELVSEWDLASDQIEFVRCQFTMPEEWAALSLITAQFKQGKVYVECLLDEEYGCHVPPELKVGPFTVSVYGYNEDGTRATSIPVKDVMHQSGYLAGAPESEKLTPDLFSQLLDEVRKIANNSTGGGNLNVTDDGSGNVSITSSGSVRISDDGNGNVTIE